MFRRSFLSSLGVLPFFGLTKNKENPKNLPVVKFEDREISNHKELLGNKDEVLVFVKKETPFSDPFFLQVEFHGEFLMTKETTVWDRIPRSIRVKMTKNTQITTCSKTLWADIKENENVS